MQPPIQTDRPGQRLFPQTNHPKLVHFALAFCLSLFLASQTTSTYTGSFMDHKSLLNTPKQLITNTLKQIKPKFNPRSSFTSNDKQQKLNVYDLSGEAKTVRKQSPKEQLPQGTYYYTDYKPLLKHLIPMTPLCPETGRTVCKDIKAYPIDSILNLILEAKANKFNFSSLFVDESQNGDMPNFNDPELDSTVAKCGGGAGSDDKQTPDYDKDEHGYRTTTNAPSQKGYEGVKSARDYKRPGSSTVYYDNSENYSPPKSQEPPNQSNLNPTGNYNSGYENHDSNPYDKANEQHQQPNQQQQRIKENANSYNQRVPKPYPSSKLKAPSVVEAQPYQAEPKPASNSAEQYTHQQPIEQYQQYKEPIQQKQTYQQLQSSIKYEQQEKHNSRPQQPSAYRSVPAQDLNYRTSNQNNYYQTRKTPTNRPGRPFQTTITIIPFIQYISQLPTNEYQISNSDKNLLDTISQSLRNAPVLNGLSPDAWLPIKAYTTDDVPSKEMAEHLATQRLASDELTSDHLSGDRLPGGPGDDELRSDYTTNYRDKRSACTESEEAAGEASKRKAPKGDRADRRADENSSVTRVKKQAGFDEEPEELCQTKRLYITPKAALNDRSEWRYIVNVGERDSRLKQVISVSVCASPNGPCSSQISLPFGYVSRCKQKYIKKKLLAIDPDGQSTSTENFFIPSCCVCEINRVNQG